MTERIWQTLSYAQTPNKPLSKVKAMAQAISEINADLYLLNEVGGIESLKNFVRHFLDDRYSIFWLESNSDRGIDLAYLLKKDSPLNAVVFSHRRRPIDFQYRGESGKTHYFSRDCLELRLFEPGRPQPVLVSLLVHLKSRREAHSADPRGFYRRRAEYRLLMKIYGTLREELPNTPFLVGGDFNGQIRKNLADEEFKGLEEKWDLEDVFDICNKPETECATQVQIQRTKPPLLLHLDHILVSPELQNKVICEQTQVYMYRSELGVPMPYVSTMEQRDLLPSDHYPVVATLADLTSS